MCIRDDGNLSRKEKGQGASTYSGNVLKHAFIFFAWFPLKIKFILSFCECFMGEVSIQPFFFFIFSVRYLEDRYHIEEVSSRGGSVGI